jgi:RNA polymerase sigma factor (sigma-70 family)
MGARGLNRTLERLCRAALTGLTDGELLDALVTRGDEAAFEALLWRHGPMVLAVCRRVLRHTHDAEDAFQATFLVLIRKATTIRNRKALGSWLYGVAYRTACKARVMNARRRLKERQAATRVEVEEIQHDIDLDAELNALPEKYRLPVVLCELDGRSRQEVARQLNIPEGTLSSRLAAARRLLAKRLRRRGWTFGAVAPVSAVLPGRLVTATVRGAGPALAGRGMAGAVSAQVIALAEGVMKSMFLNKLKTLTVAVVVLGALGVGTGRFTHPRWGEGPLATAQEPPQGPADEKQQAAPDPEAAWPELRQAAAEVEAARGALKQAEAVLTAAKAELALKEAEYRDLRRHGPRPNDKTASAALAIAWHFKYRIPVEIGWTENQDGNSIEIREVWSTQPKIKVGGLYVVRGRYKLSSQERGKLYFWETAVGNWGGGAGPILDLQSTRVQKGQGEFTLLHAMGGPGYFHLVLMGDKGQDSFLANVYFGTGDNVLRKKTW